MHGFCVGFTINSKQMSKLTSAFLFVMIIMASMMKVQAGPASCAACIGAAGGISTSGFGAAASCFTLGWPPVVCTCLAGLGMSVSLVVIITCLPICLAPTP